jgi:hypothetical protein
MPERHAEIMQRRAYAAGQKTLESKNKQRQSHTV